jgi:hypothetical protein
MKYSGWPDSRVWDLSQGEMAESAGWCPAHVFMLFFFFFFETGSHYVAQAGCKFVDPSTSASQALGLQVSTTTPASSPSFFLEQLHPIKVTVGLQGLIRPGSHTLSLSLHSIAQIKMSAQPRFKVQGNGLTCHMHIQELEELLTAVSVDNLPHQLTRVFIFSNFYYY